MGATLPKNVAIAGFPLAKVKHALQAYARTGEARNFYELVSIAPSRMETAILYEELLERGLIDPTARDPEERLSDRGRAVAEAKTRRIPLATARRVLDELLTWIERANEHADAVDLVERVWLFGPVMRGAETVGDIDLAIETVRNPAFERDDAKWREVIAQAPNHLSFPQKLYWQRQRLIFGKRRHPLLAGANLGSDELQQLGVPCQLILDRSRGGRVDDKIVSRHPRSGGRSNSMKPPLELPDLGPYLRCHARSTLGGCVRPGEPGT